jgi:two-component system heavy metal sensor histidine kinase CusS
MKLNLRSLRVRLCLWYVLLSMISMSALGAFSYIYLFHALASSRESTMGRREGRLLRFIEDVPAMNPSVELNDELHHFMLASPDTDILEVTEIDNTPIYSSEKRGSAMPIPWHGDTCAEPCFSVVRIGDHRLRALQQVVKMRGRMVRLTMAGMIDEHYDILQMVESSYLIFLPLMQVASVAGGFMLSHRALEPVDRITRAAHTISIRDLNHRLPVPQTGDELERLAETWNDLLKRLEGAVLRLTQFTSDLSHDLRTTITVMLTTTQAALNRDRSGKQYRTALKTIMLKCESTATLLDDLLAAARSDVSEQPIERLPINLTALVAEVSDHLRAKIEIKHQHLTTQFEPHVWIRGDASLIRRLIKVLMDNAIKYTGEGGLIAASVRRTERQVEWEVRDTGIGIVPEELSNIFNRFYRADSSRNRDIGGNGLGLAIAKWIADAHRSEITVSSNTNGGSTFLVSFETCDQLDEWHHQPQLTSRVVAFESKQ